MVSASLIVGVILLVGSQLHTATVGRDFQAPRFERSPQFPPLFCSGQCEPGPKCTGNHQFADPSGFCPIIGKPLCCITILASEEITTEESLLPKITVGQQPAPLAIPPFCPIGGIGIFGATCERGPRCRRFQHAGPGICPPQTPLCCYFDPSEEITTEEYMLPTTTVGQLLAPAFEWLVPLPDPCSALGVGYRCERNHCGLESYRVPGRCPRGNVCCKPDWRGNTEEGLAEEVAPVVAPTEEAPAEEVALVGQELWRCFGRRFGEPGVCLPFSACERGGGHVIPSNGCNTTPLISVCCSDWRGNTEVAPAEVEAPVEEVAEEVASAE